MTYFSCFAIAKYAQLYQILELEEYAVEIVVVDMIKYILDGSYELINVTLCLGILGVLNVFE